MQNEVIIQTQDGRNRYTFLQADDGSWRDATERAADPRPLKSPMLKWALTLAVSLADEGAGTPDPEAILDRLVLGQYVQDGVVYNVEPVGLGVRVYVMSTTERRPEYTEAT